jgi:glycosyltransferase 2 family protein
MDRKKIQLVIGLMISLGCLWLAVRNVPFSDLKTIFVDANYLWLVPAFFAQLLSVVARSMRWIVLLETPKRWQSSFWAQGIGFLFTNIFPFRLGEVARVFVMAGQCQLPVMKVAGTAIVERILDVATMVLILIFILPWMQVPAYVIRSGQSFGIIIILAILTIIILARYYDFSVKIIAKICSLSPRIPYVQIIKFWRELVNGLIPLLKLEIGFKAVGWSFISWFFSALVFLCVVLSFQPDGRLLEALFMMVAISLAVAVPSSPGFIGVYQYIGQQALVIPFGLKYSDSRALAITITAHLIYYLITTLIGVIGIVRLGQSFSTLSRLFMRGHNTTTISGEN